MKTAVKVSLEYVNHTMQLLKGRTIQDAAGNATNNDCDPVMLLDNGWRLMFYTSEGIVFPLLVDENGLVVREALS